MPAVSQYDVTNAALSLIRASRITSVDEDSLGAREARTFYPRAVQNMLDGPFDHDWSFANQRVVLASLANDREGEWMYAYALPSNMASPIRVIPDLAGAGLGIPIALPGEPYMEAWALNGVYIETPYVIEGRTLYTNVSNATLDYAINNINGLIVSQKVITALEYDLAARLAVPVKGDSKREQEMAAAARNAWEVAVADDKNRHPQTFGGYVSEAMAARRGNMPDIG